MVIQEQFQAAWGARVPQTNAQCQIHQKYMIWHMNSSTGLENRKGVSMHVSLEEISWWSLLVKETSALGAKVSAAKSQETPGIQIRFLQMFIARLINYYQKKINFTIKYFRPFSLPMSFPKWEPFQSSALLWIDPMQGKGLLPTWLLHPVIKERLQPAGRNEAKLSKH